MTTLTQNRICSTCGDAPVFQDFDDCLLCEAAVIVANPAPWESNRSHYVGCSWVGELEREVERQRAAMFPEYSEGFLRRRQAGGL